MAESIKTRFAYMPFADDGSQAGKTAKGQIITIRSQAVLQAAWRERWVIV